MITQSEFDKVLAMKGKTVRDKYTGIEGKAIGFSLYDEEAEGFINVCVNYRRTDGGLSQDWLSYSRLEVID